MFVEVKLLGPLRQYASPEASGYWHGEIPEDSKVKELINFIGIREGAIVVMIDGAVATKESLLPPKKNPKITILCQLGGG